MEDAAELTATGLLAEIRHINLGHGAEHADMHGLDAAEANRMKRDACELELVVQSRDLGQLARQPIERFDDDHIELAAACFHEEILVARPF
ncbi:hypothetical protein BoBH3_09005 [Bosea sp. BH3]|nr:hypothetical protein [Bosea sp. BH3]MCU4179695.1 hypothetical protein [Bosea sp. BH3]